MMLRAISEMASAMIVRSVFEKPVSAASSRPFWRAMTTSSSRTIGTRISAAMAWTPIDCLLQIVETFFEIERCGHAVEGKPELHHGERYLGLNTDHDRCGPA